MWERFLEWAAASEACIVEFWKMDLADHAAMRDLERRRDHSNGEWLRALDEFMASGATATDPAVVACVEWRTYRNENPWPVFPAIVGRTQMRENRAANAALFAAAGMTMGH